MSILSGFRKQKKYITDDDGNYQLTSNWTSTDTVDLSSTIQNNEHTLEEATSWDDTYDEESTQPTGMSDLVSKITTTFNNTKYLKNHTDTESILEQIQNTVINMAHPIGSLYWTKSSEDPSITFPGTEWARIKDKFIYAFGDEGEVGQPGGSKTDTKQVSGTVNSTTLTTSQIPSHSHSGIIKSVSARTDSESSEGLGLSFTYVAGVSTTTGSTNNAGGGQGHTHTFTGDNVTIDTMPPYVQYYCWIRTA